jgi:TolA-binding protein
MKTLKNKLLLLLVLFCSLFGSSGIASAQTPEEELKRSVERVKSISNSQTSALAEIAKQYFRQHPGEMDFTAPDFDGFVDALVTEKNRLPPEKRLELAKAVDELEKKYEAYTAKAADRSGKPNQPNTSTSAGTSSQGKTDSHANDNKTGREVDTSWDLIDYLVAGAGIVAGLLIIGALVFSLITLIGLRRATDEYFASVLPQTIGGVKKRQDDLARQIEASAAVNKDINQRLADVQTEFRQMSRLLQQTALTSNRQPASPANYSDRPPAPVSDMPVFPIAADDLLRQMHRKSVIVKRDFQNDMLVSDPDGKGELVLIRDSQIADEVQPLFIVPSVTQFQMRQEYYNFYEKYYDCANPESGAVWIIDPAVVEKVAGGWQLREKGVLEVR